MQQYVPELFFLILCLFYHNKIKKNNSGTYCCIEFLIYWMKLSIRKTLACVMELDDILPRGEQSERWERTEEEKVREQGTGRTCELL